MPAVGFSPSFLARCEARCSCGAGLQACGRLSSRPGPPLPTALSSTQTLPPWSKPPGLPCRRSRRQSNRISSVTGVPTPSAAKTGGVARRTARSTSTCRRPRGTRRSCGAGLQACGRLSSRSGCPLPTALSSTQTLPPWSKPPGLPCRRSRRQSNTISSVTGVRTPSAAKTGGVAGRTARSTSTCRHPREARCSCGAGFQALAPFTHRPPFHPTASPVGADRRVRPQWSRSVTRSAFEAGRILSPLRFTHP